MALCVDSLPLGEWVIYILSHEVLTAQFYVCSVLIQVNITLVYWVILNVLCCLLIFLNSTFFEKFFQEYYQSVKHLDPYCWA